jgi:hypothetical protein
MLSPANGMTITAWLRDFRPTRLPVILIILNDVDDLGLIFLDFVDEGGIIFSAIDRHAYSSSLALMLSAVRRNQNRTHLARIALYGSVTGVPIKSRLASSTPQ